MAEKQTYTIPIIRTGWRTIDFKIEASSQEEAEELAMEQASETDFQGEDDAEYAFN
jgi:hypothetical protein